MFRYASQLLVLVSVGCFVAPSFGVEDVVVLALFKNRAVLQVDGNRRVLEVGEESPEGVRLITADSERALIEVDGRRQSFSLGSHISTGYTPATVTEVRIWVDSRGMYTTTGSINGHLVNFLVDTGATLIAMNSQQAKRLGIDYRYLGQRAQVSTASGVEVAYQITLAAVKVGTIELRNVHALVLDGRFPEEVLLGMSFLGRLEMERKDRALLLRKK